MPRTIDASTPDFAAGSTEKKNRSFMRGSKSKCALIIAFGNGIYCRLAYAYYGRIVSLLPSSIDAVKILFPFRAEAVSYLRGTINNHSKKTVKQPTVFGKQFNYWF
jgi:hypothetical protein